VTDEYEAGSVIGGRYRILGKIGGGGMANVYLAEDSTLGRRVAIKMLHRRFVQDAKFVERFRREAKAAAGLNHPNIVSVYDWGQVGTENYIVMEYVQGETLKDLIRRRGRLPAGEAVQITLELLAAVGAAHENGVIHRDVKSQNILLDKEGRAKVADFGIAQAGDPAMTEAGSILGTAQYLAPEQARGEPVDKRSDLYSVGVVLYEMLTGRVPFRGDSAVTVALKHVNELPREPAEITPGLPYSLNQIVLKALAKDPNRRYGSAAEFAADLRAAQVGGPLHAATFDPSAERTQVVAPVAIPGEQVTREQVTREQSTRVMQRRDVPPGRGGHPAGTNGRPQQKRRPPAWVWLVAVAVLAAIGVAGVLIYNAAFGSTAGVPNVVGLTQADAVSRLKAAGFTPAVHPGGYSSQYDTGVVSSQAPPAGTHLRAGGTVDIYISKGLSTLQLENLVGLTAAQAADYLTAQGLVGDRRPGRSNKVGLGEVYQQRPPAGTTVKRGDTVTYWVSEGAPLVTVPDVRGMSLADATVKLQGANLLLGTTGQQPSDTVPAGEVISQDPASNTKVDAGTKVNLVISTGPSTSPSPSVTPSTSPSSSSSPSASPTSALIQVPSVITMDQPTAEQTLAQWFSVHAKYVSSSQPPGTVVNQNPLPGTMAPTGSSVTIYVSQ
jgi:serine/threonine-protein kinase